MLDNGYLSDLFPQTPMVYDIYAIQAKYGADTTTRRGNTTYGFHCNLPATDPERIIYDFTINHTPIFTIWDAGGIDTLDCSGYSGSQVINLTPGSYSSVNGMIENVAIAFNCSIEKAIGGAGNDTLIAVGNNVLTGGSGIDTFYLAAGMNTITDLGFGNVNDILTVGYKATAIAKAAGNFTATGETGNNGTAFIDANGHDVNLASAGGNNGWIITNLSGTGSVLTGSSHNDTITGGFGNDTLTGGAGVDRFYIIAGIDTITDLGFGNLSDIVTVCYGSNAIITAAGNYTATSGAINNGKASIDANGHAVNLALAGGSNGWTIMNGSLTGATLIGSSHNDTIIGGAGNDILTGGAGADKFVFRTTPDSLINHDIISDFKHGTDVLQFSKSVFTEIKSWKVDAFWSAANAMAGHDGSDRIIYNTTTGYLYYDSDGSGAEAAELVALIGTTIHPSLTYSDIQLVA
jgi:serralysin